MGFRVELWLPGSWVSSFDCSISVDPNGNPYAPVQTIPTPRALNMKQGNPNPKAFQCTSRARGELGDRLQH